MKTILLLNDTTDHDNWGSVAGAEALKAIMRDAVPDSRIESMKSSWTTSRFKVLSDRLGGKVYSGRNRLLDRFSRAFHFTPSVADEFELAADDWLSGKGREATRELLRKLHEADVIVFHAEGSTYRNNASAIRCLFALWVAKTRLGKRALFLNGSVTLTEVDPVLPAMVAKVFGALDAVAVREPRSLANVQRWAPKVSAELIPDSVFHWSPEPAGNISSAASSLLQRLEGKSFFCLSLSMLVSMQPGYMRWGPKGSSLAALIQSLKNLGLVPVLLARDGMDQAIVQGLADLTGAVFVGPNFHYREIQALFSKAEFVVSGRYHHLILAATTGCPGIAFRTSSHKVDGLCDLFESDLGSTFDPTDLWSCNESIVDRAQTIMGDGDLRQRVIERAAAFRIRTKRLGELVRDATDKV